MGRRHDAEFVEFVKGSEERLRRTAYLLTGDSQLAADIVQDALIRLYVAWPRLERAGGLHTYARKTVVSATNDHWRKPWRRERAMPLRDDAVTTDGEEATVLGCAEGTIKSQTARGLAALREQFDRQGFVQSASAIQPTVTKGTA